MEIILNNPKWDPFLRTNRALDEEVAAGSTADLVAKDEILKKIMLEILWGPSENCGSGPLMATPMGSTPSGFCQVGFSLPDQEPPTQWRSRPCGTGMVA